MNWLFKPIDIASLAFFRICFGILAFADVMGMLTYYNWYKDAYNPANFHFRYYGFQWAYPLPEPWMSLLLISLLGAAILIALGKWYRWSASYYAIGFTYMFLVEKAHYLNHGYLFCMLSFLMVLLPAHRAYSWDSLDKPSLRSDIIPFYPIFLLRFMMGLVYFMGGIAKINRDWLHAMPLKMWLGYKKDYFLIGPLLEQEWTAWFMSYAGLLLDLFIAPLLVYKRTRVFGLSLLLFFHLVNAMVFKIGIFPWLSICLSLLFFAPSFPRTAGKWLQARLGFLVKVENWWLGKSAVKNTTGKADAAFPIRFQNGIALSIVCFCIIHLLLPFRHHYFKGDVAWTEEGHRYAWRMMLRSKQGRGTLSVKNLETNEIKMIRPRDYLNPKQERKFYSHPDMILQLAHHLRDEYQETWQTDSVAVYARIRCRLNGGKYQQYTDPNVDLAQEEWQFFKASHWIVPLEEKNRKQYD